MRNQEQARDAAGLQAPGAVSPSRQASTVRGGPQQLHEGLGRDTLVGVATAGLALVALALVTWWRYDFFRGNYLAIHTLSEVFSIVVACSIFSLAWTSRNRLDSGYLLVLGVAYLSVAGLDLAHTLAYKGMGLLPPGRETNAATQLWIAARSVESLSLLAAPLLLFRGVRPYMLLVGYGLLTLLLLLSILSWQAFPTCFVEGSGLTPFKKLSEYVISAVLLGAIALLLWRRRHFERGVLLLAASSIGLTIASELAFTLYRDPYGPANLWGHALKILSFYLIYRAVVYKGLVKPHELVFRGLKQSEEALRKARDELEHRVQERTAELVEANQQLVQEAEERRRTEESLSVERRRFISLLNMLPGYVALHGDDYRIRFANHRFLEWFGEPGDRACYEISGGRTEPCPVCPLTSSGGSGSAHQWEWTSSAGRTYFVWTYPFVDIDGSEVCLTLGTDITEQKALERDALETGEQERRRIGEDLHDTVGQSLAGMAFLAKALAERLRADAAPEAADAARMEDVLNQTIVETRAIAKGLCPVEVSPTGLPDAIRELASGVESVFGLTCQVEHDGPVLLPASAATHTYRIVQEAVSNAARHAEAGNVRIRLSHENDRILCAVEDDGIGIPPDLGANKGMGLRIMRHRAGVIGATLEIRSEPGRGTRVEVRIPCPGRDAAE